MEGDFGSWVDDQEALERFNTTKECLCGADGSCSVIGRFHDHYWCSECERKYAKEKNADRAISPQKVLSTAKEGLVSASKDWNAFDLLTEHALDVQDYIEIHPSTMEKSEAWLWAHDGLFIGYLLYRSEVLRTTVIAEGFRQQGRGSEFISTWFERKDDDILTVIAFDRTKPFLEKQLDIPIEYR